MVLDSLFTLDGARSPRAFLAAWAVSRLRTCWQGVKKRLNVLGVILGLVLGLNDGFASGVEALVPVPTGWGDIDEQSIATLSYSLGRCGLNQDVEDLTGQAKIKRFHREDREKR